MVQPTRPPANAFVRLLRRIYNPIGFSKGYNFTLFFIFAGALMGFTIARFKFVDYNGSFCPRGRTGAAPGECYHYTMNPYKIGMMIHLFCMLPAGFLACLQFVPVIRHVAILFHRINGYLVLLLSVTGIAGVLMVARVTFGGGLAVQAWVGLLAIMSVGALSMAIYNIKRLQIDQHRAWMLRAWFYMASIITIRLIMILSVLIIAKLGGFWTARPCSQLAWTIGSEEKTLDRYPECLKYFNGSDKDAHVAVRMNFKGTSEQIGASLGEAFGMAAWLALALHAFGIELYLKLTPRESERLRQVSYMRQVEAGYKNPGSTGLTVERLGDADPWIPKTEYQKAEQPASRGVGYDAER